MNTFFSLSGMLEGAQLQATIYTQNYCYNAKLLLYFKQIRYLDVESKCTFFLRVGKNLGLQKQQIAHCCKKFCYSRRKMFNSKTEQRINFEIFGKIQALMEVYSKECMSRIRVFEWRERFHEGRTEIEDDECSQRPTISKTTNNNREIEKIVREDHQLSIRLIAEKMCIDKKTMWQVLHENLHMTKVCAQVVSKLLTSDQKEKCQEVFADISKHIEENPKFFDSVLTVPAMRDEFSSTTKRQRDSPCIGKLQTHHELKKQNQNFKIKIQGNVNFFFMLRVLSCSFFVWKSEWNAVLMIREERGNKIKRSFFLQQNCFMSPVLLFNSDTSNTVCFFQSQISFQSPLLQTWLPTTIFWELLRFNVIFN